MDKRTVGREKEDKEKRERGEMGKEEERGRW